MLLHVNTCRNRHTLCLLENCYTVEEDATGCKESILIREVSSLEVKINIVVFVDLGY